MKLVSSSSITRGWLEVCEHLLTQPNWTDTTVVVCMSQPTTLDDKDKRISELLNTFLVEHGRYGNHTVAETIFPAYEYLRRGTEGVYRVYPEEIFPRLKEDLKEVKKWGTYAHRLLGKRTDKDGDSYIPLEYCIEKMQDKQPKRAIYEVDFGFGADLALYDDCLDRKHRIGGPCLSHLSFKVIDGEVHLTALYRSHYYLQRAYGNFLGLARLLDFVSREAKLDVGQLVCHSTMARLEYGSGWGWNKGPVEPLLEACLAVRDSAAQKDSLTEQGHD